MTINQFEDKSLAHYSYAILSERRVALVDPARDPGPYYDFARQNNAVIAAIFETHPHADFISSHAEIHRETGAPIFASKLLSAKYPARSFDNGDSFSMGNIVLTALNTPGHSPDSICIVAHESQKAVAVFTGDTLFIGDCGRPDLREKAGALTGKRNELARKMYHSLRGPLYQLPDDVRVYPSHGAGSLCGRGLSTANMSTIGAEKISNWSLQKMAEEEFVGELLRDQPFVPKYFANAVEINRQGAPDFDISISNINILDGMPDDLDPDILIIDTRIERKYLPGAPGNSINLMLATKFETWLGSIVSPGEPFYLIATSREEAAELIRRTAEIGYEMQIRSVLIENEIKDKYPVQCLNADTFREHPDNYTIIDVRNTSEVNQRKIFANAISIPLPELRERLSEIPVDKPIVVHCAAGYRSVAAVSIIRNSLNSTCEVFDLGEAVVTF